MKTTINLDDYSNPNYREVLYTTEKDFQIVTMNLKPKENIGLEIHKDSSQMFYVLDGSGVAYIDGKTLAISTNDFVVADRGEKHDILNTGIKDLRLLTIYSKQEHEEGLVQECKRRG